MDSFKPLADDIVWLPSPNYGYGNAHPFWRAVTWHIAEGSLSGTLAWLTNPVSRASAHFVVGRNAEIFQLVRLDQPAWAHGYVCSQDDDNPIVRQTYAARVNPNLRSYAIECIGYSGHGWPGTLTQVQAAALQRLTAFLCLRSVLSADRTHILGHYQWDACTRPNCPGFSSEEWEEWIARVKALTSLWRGW